MSKTLLKKITMETCGGESRAYPGIGCVYVLGTAELTEEEAAELKDAGEAEDEEIQEAVVDAGLCEEIDCKCGRILKAAVEKACKAAGLAFESLEPCAMWED